MAAQRPTGVTRDVRYGFSKVFVDDLDRMAAFYEEVFGLIAFDRHKGVMLGREIEEITYRATHEGANALELITYCHSSGPVAGESVQGFITDDLDALLDRAKAAGGSVPGAVNRFEALKVSVTFVLDPEGHVNEVVQVDRD